MCGRHASNQNGGKPCREGCVCGKHAGHGGHAISEETRRKISVANSNPSKETREKKRVARLGRVLSEETRAKIGAALRGRKATPEARANMRRAQRAAQERHAVACDGGCNYVTCSPPRRLTGLALDLAGVLIDHGYDLIPEVRFGHYTVDFYEPELHIAFEADGQYWHRLPGRIEHDVKRDAYLLVEHDLPVWRFAEGVIAGMQGL